MTNNKTKFYVTRHGQTQWNYERRAQGQLNSNLTQLGKIQAEKLGNRLKDIELDIAYTSTLGRTIETAKIALKDRPLKVYHLDELKEFNFGSWEGESWKEIEAKEPQRLNDFWKNPMRYVPDTGESYDVFIDRIKAIFESLATVHFGQSVLTVVHGGVIKALMYAYHHGRLEEFWTAEPYAHPTSLSILIAQDKILSFDMLPDASHLNAEHL